VHFKLGDIQRVLVPHNFSERLIREMPELGVLYHDASG